MFSRRSAGQRSRATAAILLVLAGPGMPGVAADHAQTDGGRVVAFDHRGGNEWWVEVFLAGQDGGLASGVSAMDEGGPWIALQKRSWGNWAASFHIEPGHRVRFMAAWSGGAQAQSCWFTHPAGVEACDGDPSPPAFAATFTLVTGNEWWVQTQVTPNEGTVARVDVRLNGGEWKPLKLQSWGVREWAASYHAPEGTIVQFQATGSTGATSTSSCYRWIPPQGGGQTAPEVSCTGPSPFTARFGNVKGNGWWVETTVSASRALAGVDARRDGGTWQPLTLRSWGAWAASFRIPDGSHVQLRARSTDGAFAFAPNGWSWPGQGQVPAPGSTFDALFENVQGNSDWVQVNVYASSNWGLKGVSARVDGGAWQPLRLQTWGDWASSIHVPGGGWVQFRAESGATLVSGRYVWPSATPVHDWPQEGSFATYELSSHQSEAGGFFWDTTAVHRVTYHAGNWTGLCTGRTIETQPDGTARTVDWTYETHQGPRAAMTTVQPGDTTNPRVTLASGQGQHCELWELIVQVERVGEHRSALKDRDGNPVSVMAFEASETPDSVGIEDIQMAWERHFGLVLDWHRDGHASNTSEFGGRLVDTDAPVR